MIDINYLKIAELIPDDPWITRDIGMISECNIRACMYCEVSKELGHAPDCPWPELRSLAKQMKDEHKQQYGTKAAIRRERWKRNYKPPREDDED